MLRDPSPPAFLSKQYHRYRWAQAFHRDEECTSTWEEPRSAGFRLPGFVTSTNEADFEKNLFPSPGDSFGNIYLVDRKGVVVQSNKRTSPMESLYWTLERVFDCTDLDQWNGV